MPRYDGPNYQGSIGQKLKVLFGISGLRLIWEHCKEQIKLEYPTINLKVLNRNLGPHCGYLVDLVRAAKGRREKGTATGDNGAAEIQAAKAGCLYIIAKYKLICDREIANQSYSPLLREGWQEMKGKVEYMEGTITSQIQASY